MKIEQGDLVEVKAKLWNHVDAPEYIAQAIVEGDEMRWGPGHLSVKSHIINVKDVVRVVKKQVIPKHLFYYLQGDLFLTEPPGHVFHDPKALEKWQAKHLPFQDWGDRESHFVSVHPGIYSGEPTIDLHQLPAEQIANIWWVDSLTLERVEDNWPGISRGAVLVCCWYVAHYGKRKWKQRWGEWLKVADGELWSGHYDTCPMPPQAPEKEDKEERRCTKT